MPQDDAKLLRRRNKDLFTVSGVSGLMRYGTGGPGGMGGASGIILDEWRRDLVSERGIRQFREMSDEDPIVGALLFAIRMLIRQVDWNVAPANTSTKAAEAAALVDSALHDMEVSFPDTICEILSMLIYGFHYAEILYKVRGGPNLDDPTQHSKHTDHKIGWRAWATRSQDSLFQWSYDEDDRLAGMIQLGPPDYQYHFVPLNKSMLFRTDTYKGNPQGRSILRNAYQSYYDVKHIRQIEGIGIERDLAGVPVMGVPPNVMLGTSKEDQASLAQAKKIVTNLKRDEQEGIVMPLAYDADGKEVYKLWLLSTGGARQFDTSKIIERYESRIAMTCLADFVLLGHETTGTYSLGESKLGVFSLAISAWLDTIGAIINDVAVAALCALNGYEAEDTPRIEHQDVEKADLAGLGSFLTVLSQTGLLPKDPQLIRHLFAAAGLPEPEDDVLDAHVDVHQQQQHAQAAQAQASATMAAQTAKDGAPPTAGKAPAGKTPARTPKLEASEPPYRYGSTQLDLPPRHAERVRAFGRTIDPDDLAADGVEDNPHVTVRYGLTRTNATDRNALTALCRQCAPMTLQFGRTASFPASEPGGDYDVLYVPVRSTAVHRLNRAIAGAVETVTTHPEYIPHLTVAYLKPGTAQKYLGQTVLDAPVTIAQLTLSDQDGTKTRLPFKVLRPKRG